jgi:DNA-binding response OmpR family regulator
MRILVIEDDMGVASFVRRGLREQNYVVDLAADGEEALFLAQTGDYDAIILDLVLPKASGLEVARALRRDAKTVPILILSAKEDLESKVTGLDAGADDYLTKPFRFEELLARLRALLRRQTGLLPQVLRLADLELDSLRRRVRRGGCEIALTSREYSLLEYLMRKCGQVVTRTMLAEHVWEHDFDPMSNVIDVHISRLRRKIDAGFEPKLLQTIRGSGYVLRSPRRSAGEG